MDEPQLREHLKSIDDATYKISNDLAGLKLKGDAIDLARLALLPRDAKDLRGQQFSRCLVGNIPIGTVGAVFYNCVITQNHKRNENLVIGNLPVSSARYTQLRSKNGALVGADVHPKNIPAPNITADIQDSKIVSSTFSNLTFVDVWFYDTEFKDCVFRHCVFSTFLFERCVLENVMFDHCVFVDSSIPAECRMEGCTLSNSTFMYDGNVTDTFLYTVRGDAETIIDNCYTYNNADVSHLPTTDPARWAADVDLQRITQADIDLLDNARLFEVRPNQ